MLPFVAKNFVPLPAGPTAKGNITMQSRKIQLSIKTLAVIVVLGATAISFAADREKVLYNLPKCTGSTNCASTNVAIGLGMIFDKAGNLYGAYQFRGTSGSKCHGYGCGYVFKLAPTTTGLWKETALYNFCSLANCADGAIPSSGLAFDVDGNLYGTTWYGGMTTSGCGGDLCGTVFKLTLGANGKWTETVLHSFTGGPDGAEPAGTAPIFDSAGNLYGTTLGGGHGYGTVFKLTRGTKEPWTEAVLHSFQLNGTDGIVPVGLVSDTAGNLYGTTAGGGKYSSANCTSTLVQNPHCGTVYLLSPNGNGTWKESVLHNFQSNGKDGIQPLTGVILDAKGNLDGTTEFGGEHGFGTVFQLVHGTWAENILQSFETPTANDSGSAPLSGLILDSAGNLYGTTLAGGAAGCGDGCGTVFELSHGSSGWTETVLHDFSTPADGTTPTSPLSRDKEGNLYGNTLTGGANDAGVVFEILPATVSLGTLQE
jgi:uncharacterized repeat protein (TIGR03803 family)